MLGKLESTVSFENFPINPEILELSSWIGKMHALSNSEVAEP